MNIPTDPRFMNLAGQRYNLLTVEGYAGKIEPSRKNRWHCRCACGEVRVVTTNDLRTGNTQSCGCLSRSTTTERNRKHDGCGTRLYRIWKNMLNRCRNPNSDTADDYLHRGITVCDRWRTSFDHFREDMGEPPTIKHSIDRIDNDGPYMKDNCRWSTASQQSRNRRSNVMLTYNGVTRCAAEWAELTGMSGHMLRRRKQRGWSDEDTLTRTAA